MPRARLTVTLPEDTWLGGPSRRHPTARFHVRSAFPDADGGVALVAVDAGDALPAVVAALDDHPDIRSLALLARDGDRAVCQVDATMDVLALVREARVPVAFPVRVHDGTMRFDLRADASHFAALADRLDETGVDYTVGTVEPLDAPETALTPRQRRTLRLAVDRGFYAVPRECELRDLADELGVAPSTCSETLRRATGVVLEQFLDGGGVGE